MGDIDCGGCGDCNCDFGNCCDCGDCNCDCSGGEGENCCNGCECCCCECGDHGCCACEIGGDYVACPSWFCPCCHHSDHLSTYCCFSCGVAASDFIEAVAQAPVTSTTSSSKQQQYYGNGAHDWQDERRQRQEEDGIEPEDVPLRVVTDQPLGEDQRQTMGNAVTTQPVSRSNALLT